MENMMKNNETEPNQVEWATEEAQRLQALRQEMLLRQNPFYLPTMSMPELYDTVYDSRPPIIDGLLYPGTYILAGAPKLGKSFLMAQMAYHVSTGTPLWEYPVHGGSVLYLALEDDYSRLQRHLYQMFGVETAEKLYLGTEAHTLNTGLTDQLGEFVRQHPDTKLIIIDTLQKVREGAGDGCSYASDYQDIARLKRFTDGKSLCLMIVHHTRKQQADDKFDMISGFLLSKEKRTSNAATLEIAGRDQPDQKLYLQRDSEKLLWRLERADVSLWKEPPDTVLETISKVINAERPEWQGTATELVGLLGMDIKPNALTMRLNVNAGRLFSEHGVRYQNKHGHGARQIILRYEPA